MNLLCNRGRWVATLSVWSAQCCLDRQNGDITQTRGMEVHSQTFYSITAVCVSHQYCPVSAPQSKRIPDTAQAGSILLRSGQVSNGLLTQVFTLRLRCFHRVILRITWHYTVEDIIGADCAHINVYGPANMRTIASPLRLKLLLCHAPQKTTYNIRNLCFSILALFNYYMQSAILNHTSCTLYTFAYLPIVWVIRLYVCVYIM